MIAHRFKSRTPSVPTLLTETGDRHSGASAKDYPPPTLPPEPSGQSPPRAASPVTPLPAPTPTAVPPAAPDPSPPPPMRNAERIALDRQKITDGGVLNILPDHVRGDRELSPSQISTAFGLLRKILPDFSASAAPRDSESGIGATEDDPSSTPQFEVHIVDPKET
jgi:hypothetical protein